MSKPKEDPNDKKARLRERRISLLEQGRAARKTAGNLSSDMQSVYGLKGLSGFGQSGTSMMSLKK